MSRNAEIRAFGLREDARDLDAVARILRRRWKKGAAPDGIVLSRLCRLLTDEAMDCRAEAEATEGGAA